MEALVITDVTPVHPDLLVVNKPSGIPVIPARGEPPDACLHRSLEASRGERLWVVHRIDRETSGLVVFARTADAHRALNIAFERRQVAKEYVAYAAGALEGVSRIDVAIHAARRGKSRPAMPGERAAKTAVTEVAVERRWTIDAALVSRVRCRPITGRHHQIRVHLRAAGAPILHDPLYGKVTTRGPLADAPCGRLALHAAALTIPAGSTRRSFVAEPPADLCALEAWLDGLAT